MEPFAFSALPTKGPVFTSRSGFGLNGLTTGLLRFGTCCGYSHKGLRHEAWAWLHRNPTVWMFSVVRMLRQREVEAPETPKARTLNPRPKCPETPKPKPQNTKNMYRVSQSRIARLAAAPAGRLEEVWLEHLTWCFMCYIVILYRSVSIYIYTYIYTYTYTYLRLFVCLFVWLVRW